MKLTAVFTALAVAAGCVTQAHAQAYPSHPITIIVPFPAGGPSDTLARILGERMRVSLGQPVIVENVTGAGASIGVVRVAQSALDGYTLGIGNWTSHVGSGAMYPAAHDALLDLQPIARISATPLMIVGKNALPPRNAGELIAWLKANPGKASAATVGAGSGAHVCLLYFAQKTGTNFQLVPYRGGAPVMQDLIAGQIDMFCAEASQTLSFLRSGAMKPFAVMVEGTLAGRPRGPDHGRGRRARNVHFVLEWFVGSEGHAQGDHRPAQRSGRGGAGRPRRAAAADGIGSRHRHARRADAGSAGRISPGRDREVVADHQGG